jgi:hypothetical protein
MPLVQFGESILLRREALYAEFLQLAIEGWAVEV